MPETQQFLPTLTIVITSARVASIDYSVHRWIRLSPDVMRVRGDHVPVPSPSRPESFTPSSESSRARSSLRNIRMLSGAIIPSRTWLRRISLTVTSIRSGPSQMTIVSSGFRVNVIIITILMLELSADSPTGTLPASPSLTNMPTVCLSPWLPSLYPTSSCSAKIRVSRCMPLQLGRACAVSTITARLRAAGGKGRCSANAPCNPARLGALPPVPRLIFYAFLLRR